MSVLLAVGLGVLAAAILITGGGAGVLLSARVDAWIEQRERGQ